MSITNDDKNSITYFHRWKDDITRWCSWEDRKEAIFEEVPQLKRAMDDVKSAEDYLNYVVDKYFEEEYPDE